MVFGNDSAGRSNCGQKLNGHSIGKMDFSIESYILELVHFLNAITFLKLQVRKCLKQQKSSILVAWDTWIEDFRSFFGRIESNLNLLLTKIP